MLFGKTYLKSNNERKIPKDIDPTSATKAPKVNLSYHSFITCPTKLFLAKTKAIISTRITAKTMFVGLFIIVF